MVVRPQQILVLTSLDSAKWDERARVTPNPSHSSQTQPPLCKEGNEGSLQGRGWAHVGTGTVAALPCGPLRLPA